MSQAMENIVRPFESGDVFNARRAAVVPFVAAPLPEAVVKSWGKGIPAEWQQWTGVIMDAVVTNYVEKSRTTSIQRIENPENPSNFVDVERTESMVLQREDGQELQLNFNNGGA